MVCTPYVMVSRILSINGEGGWKKQFTRLACACEKSPDRLRCDHEQVERGELRGPQCAIKQH